MSPCDVYSECASTCANEKDTDNDTDNDMKTIAIINQKGGVGKTTIATGLAVDMERKGKRTLLIDADDQRNLLRWSERRTNERPRVITCATSRIQPEITAAEQLGASYTIIDTPGVAKAVAFQIAGIADLVLVPVGFSMHDLDSTLTTIQMIHRLGVPHMVVVNGLRANSQRKFEELKGALEKNYKATVYPGYIATRVVHADCVGDGLSVHEYEPKGKAEEEISALHTYIRKHFAKTTKEIAA